MTGIVERLLSFSKRDLDELCEATSEAIADGNGFGWLRPPPRAVLERYWQGVLLVPERELYVARLDQRIVGTAQLLKPPANNEAAAHRASLATFFVAPWARGYGLARGLLRTVEEAASTHGFESLELDVRATQEAAITLCENAGFQRWAVKPRYARVNGQYIDGYFYSKALPAAEAAGRPGADSRPGRPPA